MEKRKRIAGGPIMLMGAIILGLYLPKIDFDHIRTVEYVLLGSVSVFFLCGLYAFVKSLRKIQADKDKL